MVATEQMQEPRSITPYLLLIAAGVALAVVLALSIPAVAEQVRENGAHTVKHGPVVDAIHRCLERNGPAQVWQSRSWRQPNKQYLTCEYEPGRWGLMIVERVRAGWREVSTFRVKSGSAAELQEYLSAIGRLVR